MTNNADIRKAHRIVINAGGVMTREQIDFLSSMLPPLPKQKTLEELTHDVYDVWAGTNGNEWPDDIHGELETWLSELHIQMQGLKDAPATVPALPAGMRIAEHEDYGRCVVSPSDDESNDTFRIFYRDEGYVTDSVSRYVESSSLTFIDTEPAKPAPTHPEFLETEADYQNAPEGTIVAYQGLCPWVKLGDRTWEGTGVDGSVVISRMCAPGRRVLRWGRGE